jgi:hypothetical protein
MDHFAQGPHTGPISTWNGFSEIQAYGRRIRGALMRRPNYRFERAERDRMKQVKKEEKLRRQQERASQQISEEADQPALPTASNNGG